MASTAEHPHQDIDTQARELLRRLATLSGLDEPAAIARAVLGAALELAHADSAIILRGDRSGTLAPWMATGPLAVGLAEHGIRDLDGLRGHERVVAAVGLYDEDTLIGALAVASTDDRPRDAESGELELLELLAAHAASRLRGSELVRTLRAQAASDPLTGLGHRASFQEALAASHRRPVTAVVLCDIDCFKHINDTFGHQRGDQVLCDFAETLAGAMRRGDTLYRLGGDEFAALIVVADEREALDATHRLHQAVVDADLGVTVSLGVAVPFDGESDASLLARADRALYGVKRRGRDGVALAARAPRLVAAAPAA